MNHIILDGQQFHTTDELHRILQRLLQLPDFYGANLDALWDCLTGMIELPVKLEWVHYDTSLERLGQQAEQVLLLMEEVQDLGKGFSIVVRN